MVDEVWYTSELHLKNVREGKDLKRQVQGAGQATVNIIYTQHIFYHLRIYVSMYVTNFIT